jgi:DNA-binding response OmpR family regulator
LEGRIQGAGSWIWGLSPVVALSPRVWAKCVNSSFEGVHVSDEKLKLVVVEDELEIARAMETYGKHHGYETHLANDGAQALALIRSVRPDVLLLDVHLPHMDGRDIMRKVKDEALLPDNAVVLFVSARDEQSDRLVGLELGADDYETKPIHFNNLFKKIERLRAKKKSEA